MPTLHTFRRSVARGLYALVKTMVPVAYAGDGLITVHSHAFLKDCDYLRAYGRGVQAIGGTDSYQWHWRVHIGLWVASVAARVSGDFVECGVNRGFLSSAIMEYLNWNSLSRDFYLLDTFAGLDEHLISDQERGSGAKRLNVEKLKNGFYVSDVEGVRANFAQWPRAHIIQGSIPGTLCQVPSRQIAYLHLDMNCAQPEISALTHFWDRLTPGAPVLLDDYAYLGYTPQRLAMDQFSLDHSVSICSLPTGQGLMLKPPGNPLP